MGSIIMPRQIIKFPQGPSDPQRAATTRNKRFRLLHRYLTLRWCLDFASIQNSQAYRLIASADPCCTFKLAPSMNNRQTFARIIGIGANDTSTDSGHINNLSRAHLVQLILNLAVGIGGVYASI